MGPRHTGGLSRHEPFLHVLSGCWPSLASVSLDVRRCPELTLSATVLGSRHSHAPSSSPSLLPPWFPRYCLCGPYEGPCSGSVLPRTLSHCPATFLGEFAFVPRQQTSTILRDQFAIHDVSTDFSSFPPLFSFLLCFCFGGSVPSSLCGRTSGLDTGCVCLLFTFELLFPAEGAAFPWVCLRPVSPSAVGTWLSAPQTLLPPLPVHSPTPRCRPRSQSVTDLTCNEANVLRALSPVAYPSENHSSQLPLWPQSPGQG